MSDQNKQQTLGEEIIEGLSELSEAVANGETLSERFKVTTASKQDDGTTSWELIDGK